VLQRAFNPGTAGDPWGRTPLELGCSGPGGLELQLPVAPRPSRTGPGLVVWQVCDLIIREMEGWAGSGTLARARALPRGPGTTCFSSVGQAPPACVRPRTGKPLQGLRARPIVPAAPASRMLLEQGLVWPAGTYRNGILLVRRPAATVGH